MFLNLRFQHNAMINLKMHTMRELTIKVDENDPKIEDVIKLPLTKPKHVSIGHENVND